MGVGGGKAFQAERRAGMHLTQGLAGHWDQASGTTSLCPVQTEWNKCTIAGGLPAWPTLGSESQQHDLGQASETWYLHLSPGVGPE